GGRVHPPYLQRQWAWRDRWAYMLVGPAVLLIAMWSYWPLVQGSVVAFQNYNVAGHSRFVGAQNFASVLFDSGFWHAMSISLVYAGLFMIFGFGAPIVLALLLQEVPRGSLVFRTLYYLPAVLSGVVVIFLWKSFFSPDGLINHVINTCIALLNHLPTVHLNPV